MYNHLFHTKGFLYEVVFSFFIGDFVFKNNVVYYKTVRTYSDIKKSYNLWLICFVLMLSAKQYLRLLLYTTVFTRW